MKQKSNGRDPKRSASDDRPMSRIPVKHVAGMPIYLTRSADALVRIVIREFCSLWTPGGTVLHVSGGGAEFDTRERHLFEHLGVAVKTRRVLPDVVVYFEQKNRLVLVESVTSHGPVDGKRHAELSRLFRDSTAGLVYVTAFPNRAVMKHYLGDIAWETEVWVADSPSHLIHFNGERFLGPHTAATTYA